MDRPKAEALLERAALEADRTTRHLLVGAALADVLSVEPIVVGGVAEDFYTGDRYKPTDLDMCAPISREDMKRLRALGFEREGRHWFHEATHVAVEFPDERIDGDERRTRIVDLGIASVKMIGLDDLYLDRLRQATMTERDADVAFLGAVAIAAARFEEIDWRYVKRVIARVSVEEPAIGRAMQGRNRRARRRAKDAIAGA